jgi:hypothetical protein
MPLYAARSAQRILTPDLCPDEIFYAAFGALAAQN